MLQNLNHGKRHSGIKLISQCPDTRSSECVPSTPSAFSIISDNFVKHQYSPSSHSSSSGRSTRQPSCNSTPSSSMNTTCDSHHSKNDVNNNSSVSSPSSEHLSRSNTSCPGIASPAGPSPHVIHFKHCTEKAVRNQSHSASVRLFSENENLDRSSMQNSRQTASLDSSSIDFTSQVTSTPSVFARNSSHRRSAGDEYEYAIQDSSFSSLDDTNSNRSGRSLSISE